MPQDCTLSVRHFYKALDSNLLSDFTRSLPGAFPTEAKPMVTTRHGMGAVREPGEAFSDWCTARDLPAQLEASSKSFID